MPIWWSDPTSQHAFILSWISLVVTIIAAIVGIVGSLRLESPLLLVYGLENIIDFFSSAIVVWRFYTPSSGVNEQDADRDARLEAREKRASVAITIVIAMLGFSAILSAVNNLVDGDEVSVDDLWTLYYLSFVSLIIFGTLTLLKLRFAAKLKSPSLRKDGICSAIGAILALALFVNTFADLSSNGALWWLDPTVAFICGIGCLVYGLRGIYKAYVRDNHPIFSISWWRQSDTNDAQKGLEMKTGKNANESNQDKTTDAVEEENMTELELA